MRPSRDLVARIALGVCVGVSFVPSAHCSDSSPLVTSAAVKVLADDGGGWDYFGSAVDIDGDHMIVGAYYADDGMPFDTGAAYIYRRNQLSAEGWEQVARLVPPSPSNFDYFGVDVAISGDTAVVGMEETFGEGTVFVYQRNRSGPDAWGLTTTLRGSDTDENHRFGHSVDLDGETLVVGAWGGGCAYVFRRISAGSWGWNEVAKLTPSDDPPGSGFGYSVGVSGTTAVVGSFRHSGTASEAGAAYIFERNYGGVADSWGEVVRIEAGDPDEMDRFGRMVAIDGNVVVVAAYEDDESGEDAGAAYVFQRNVGGADAWNQVRKLMAGDAAEEDYFGCSVGVDDATVVVGARLRDLGGVPNAGAVYIFERNHGGADNWGEVDVIVPDEAASDFLGASVAIDGTFVAAGAYGDDDNGSVAGAAWVYVRDGELWLQEASPYPLDGEDDDRFGTSVGIDGDFAIIGAMQDDEGAVDTGSVYILERNQGGRNSWQHVAKLVASDASEEARFGVAVDISSGTAIVGANWDDEVGDYTGAAYIFERNHPTEDGWGEVKKLAPADLEDHALFGLDVAIDRDTAVVGAQGDNGASFLTGSAYVYGRNHGGPDNWGLVTELVPSDPAFQDYFGVSVDIDGDLAVVGATHNDDLGDRTGSAYVFSRHHGGPDAWGQVAKLVGHEADELFGCAVAVDGSRVVVGAQGNDEIADNAGAGYVYERNSGGFDDDWGLVATLLPVPGTNAGADFGTAVDISGNRIAVAVRSDYSVPSTFIGARYLYEQNQGGAEAWGQIAKVFPAYGVQGYACDVALTATELVYGGTGSGQLFTKAGRAYIHRLAAPESDLSVAIWDEGRVATTPGTTVTYSVTTANAGPDRVSGAVLTDALDASVFDTSSAVWTCSPDPGSGPATGCPASGGAAALAAGVLLDMEAGNAVTVVVTVPLLTSASGVLTNEATIDAPPNVYDPVLENNRASDTNTLRELDFGDAPDPGYPTLLASAGAAHGIDPLVRLGSAEDGEVDGQPDATATGDDTDGTNDDDGVVFRTALVRGRSATVDIETGAAAFVSGWIDFNLDGDWDDEGEQVVSDAAVTAGVNTLEISVPTDATLGLTYARFRLCSSGGIGVVRIAEDGEVEDYRLTIEDVLIFADGFEDGDIRAWTIGTP